MSATKRRKKGQGTLRHLGGDRWQVVIRVDGHQMTRVFRARNGTVAQQQAGAIAAALPAEREAAAIAAQRAEPIEDAERSERGKWTVAEYADFYLAVWAQAHLAHTTYRRYEQIIKDHVKTHLGHLKIREVTATHLQQTYRVLASKGARKRGGGGPLSGPSIWTVHNVIRAMFTFATEIQEDFERNPAASKGARPLDVERTGAAKRAVDVQEVEQFVSAAVEQAPSIAVPVMLSAWLGTRRSETLALKWSDVDYKSHLVVIQRSVTQAKGGRVVVRETTKTGKRRSVPIDEHTVSALKRLQSEKQRHRGGLGDDRICLADDGGMVKPATFETMFRTFARKIGMDITPHLLRHAFVSQLIALGYDAVTISAITGHSPDVLLRTYAHSYDTRRREAVDRLGEERQRAREGLQCIV